MSRFKPIAVALTLLLLTDLWSPLALGATLGQGQFDPSATPQQCREGYACAQIFTADATGTVERVSIPLSWTGDTADLKVEVRTLSGSVLGADILAEGQLRPSGAGTDPTWVDVPLQARQGKRLSKGTSYALVVTTAGESNPAQPTTYHWHYRKYPAAGPGNVLLEYQPGQWRRYDDFDFAYEIVLTQSNAAPVIHVQDTVIMEEDGTYQLPLQVEDENPAKVQVTAHSKDTWLVTDAGLKVSGSGANRVLTITPVPDAHGTGTIVLTATDEENLYTNAEVQLTVTPVNDEPLLIAQVADLETPESTAVAIPVRIGTPSRVTALQNAGQEIWVSDPDGDDLTIDVSTDAPDLLSVAVTGTGANRQLNILPVAGRSGRANVTVTVSDGAAAVTHTFPVTVTAVDEPPVIDPAKLPNRTIDEDEELQFEFIVSDPDTPLADLKIEVTSDNPGLFGGSPTIEMDPAGSGRVSVRWMPEPDENGTANITVSVSDGTSQTTATFKVDVRAKNDPPRFAGSLPPSVTTKEDTPYTFHVTADDPDKNDVLTLHVFSSNTKLLPSSRITIEEISAGYWNVVLDPSPNEHGQAQITVQVVDRAGEFAEHRFVLTVDPVNDEPVIDDIPDVFRELGVTQIDVTVRVTDVESTASGLTVTANALNPLLIADVLTQNIGPEHWRITLIPRAGQEGSTQVVVQASDGDKTVTKSFTVGIAQRLKFTGLPEQAVVDEDGTAVFEFEVSPADKIQSVTATSRDTTLLPDNRITLSQLTPGRYRLELEPAPDQFGKVVVVVEGKNLYDMPTTHYLTLTVNPVNDPPVLNPIASPQRTQEDVRLSIPFYLYDPDPFDRFTFHFTSSNDHVVPPFSPYLTVEGSGTNWVLHILPFKDAYGSTVITMTVEDSGKATASTTFELIVDPVDDPPVIRLPSSATMDEDTTAFFEIVVEDVDGPGGTQLDATSPYATVRATLVKSEGWIDTYSLQVTPQKDRSGPIPVNLVVRSGSAQVASAVLTVHVREINDPPELTVYAGRVETYEDQPASVSLAVFDVETPLDRLSLTAVSDNPTLLPPTSFRFVGTGTQRELIITPAEDQFGEANVVVTLSDGAASVSSDPPIHVVVISVPDAPRLLGLGSEIIINEDERFVREVEVYDPDSPMSEVEIDLTFDVDPANPGLLAANGVRLEGTGKSRRLVVEPEKDQSGTATINIRTRSRDDNAEDLIRIPLTVRPVNDPPELSEFNYSHRTILEDQSLTGMSLTYMDVDSPLSSLTATISADNKELLPDGSMSVILSNGRADVSVIPAKDRWGTATVTLTISDGQDSSSRFFRLTVEPVNDPPSFVKGPDQTVEEDAPPQRVARWATDITPGPYEDHQQLRFEVDVLSGAELFAEGPEVTADGTLIYTPAPDKFGTAEVEIWLVDDGGTANGGEDTSPRQKFFINILPVNDPPVIAPIPPIGTEIGQMSDEILITVTDVDSDVSRVVLTVHSENPSLVPNDAEHIIVTPAGPGQWKLRLKPVDGKIGTAKITVTATDPEGDMSRLQFDLVVNNLWLSSLVPSDGTMTPQFSSRVLGYTVVYSGWLPRVHVTATAQDDGVRIRVRRADAPDTWHDAESGKLSPPITLGESGGAVEVEVYSPVTGISKSYLLTFVRSKSTVAELVDLSINPGRLQPEFRPDRTTYSATVPHEVTEVAVEYQAGDAWAKVTVEGNKDLKVGTNRITVTVLAESGDKRVYTINLTREAGPMQISEVEVETGADWATLRFETDDSADVIVYYRPDGGAELSRPAGRGYRHVVTLTGLRPATRYTFRIQATRSNGPGAELISSFRTQAPEATGRCEVGFDGSLICPATPQERSWAVVALPDGAAPDQAAVVSVSDLDMGAAVAAALAEGTDDAHGTPTVSVWLDSDRYGAALLEAQALQRAAGWGIGVTVESPLGSVTLTPTFIANLGLAQGERLVVAITEGEIDPLYLEPWLGVGGYRLAGEPMAVSLARVDASGVTRSLTTWPAPLVVSHPVWAANETEAATTAVFAKAPGRTQLEPLGGRLSPDGDRIEVAQSAPGSTVLLTYDHRFTDVPPTHWAHRIVHEMAARQVLRGVTQTRFAPEQPITRGQLAAILVRALQLGEDDRFARVYYDISPYDALAPEIGGAIRSGIMMGYPDGTFRPNAPVTRQELAVVLSRMADRLNLAGSIDREVAERLALLADWNDVASWAQDGVRYAVAEGLMTGRSATTFAPLELTTRAEAATVIKRLLDKVAPGEWR